MVLNSFGINSFGCLINVKAKEESVLRDIQTSSEGYLCGSLDGANKRKVVLKGFNEVIVIPSTYGSSFTFPNEKAVCENWGESEIRCSSRPLL